MKIALVHDYLVHTRGGERVLWVLTEMFPTADIYVLVYDPHSVPQEWHAKNIRTSFIQRLPLSARLFRAWLPLYPYAVEEFDLNDYDLVISSSSGFAHGVITQAETCHICYSHSPFRYAWSFYHNQVARQNLVASFVFGAIIHQVRQWDRVAAERVDYYGANSEVTRRRIWKFYRKEAVVINPPIDVSQFSLADEAQDFHLIVSSLMPYKRLDIAIEAFNRLGLPLKIIGEGPDFRRLKAMARSNIEFLGVLPDAVVRHHYSRCRAFIFTAEEDYGITPLEAQASGRPVIAYAAGGALETVVDNVTGLFFPQQTADSLAETVARFDPSHFDSHLIREHATKFDIAAFEKRMTAFIREKLTEHRTSLGLGPIAWPEEGIDG